MTDYEQHKCPRCGYFHRKPTWTWCHTCRRNKKTGERFTDYQDRMRELKRRALIIEAPEKKQVVEVIA